MDFKFRLPQTRGTQPSKADKYKMPTKQFPTTQQQNPFRKTTSKQSLYPPSNPNPTKLNKYKRAASQQQPTNQFKKYMVDSANVFYEDRYEVKKLDELATYIKILVVVWFFCCSSYLLIGRIQPYEGECPKNAKCLVFARCQQNFELNDEETECVLEKQLKLEIKTICIDKVKELQYSLGELKCTDVGGNIEDIKFKIAEFMRDVLVGGKGQYEQLEIVKFFESPQNQDQHGFKLEGYGSNRVVKPTQQAYKSWCYLKMKLDDTYFMLKAFAFLAGIALAFLVYRSIQDKRKIRQMYNYLERQVQLSPQNTINVTHTLPEMQAKFGQVSEDQWTQINQIRANEKRIVYYEQDFLYWKMSS